MLVIIQLIVRLYNFRENTVGISQKKNVFMPNLGEISDEALKIEIDRSWSSG